MRGFQIVQSVMQGYQYVLSRMLPVCNLLVQGPKVTYCLREQRLFCNLLLLLTAVRTEM